MFPDAAGLRLLRSLFLLTIGVPLAGPPPAAAQGTGALPSDVRDVIRERYVSAARETRYLEAAVDLDADGQVEFLVHLAGGNCADAGCPTLVFTHLASGYRLLSTIAGADAPIRVSPDKSSGWQNLIVRVAGGAAARDVELKFDGRGYPDDATVSSGRAKTTKRSGRTVIAALPFERMKLFPAGTR